MEAGAPRPTPSEYAAGWTRARHSHSSGSVSASGSGVAGGERDMTFSICSTPSIVLRCCQSPSSQKTARQIGRIASHDINRRLPANRLSTFPPRSIYVFSIAQGRRPFERAFISGPAVPRPLPRCTVTGMNLCLTKTPRCMQEPHPPCHPTSRTCSPCITHMLGQRELDGNYASASRGLHDFLAVGATSLIGKQLA